jgi:hypothetical protein
MKNPPSMSPRLPLDEENPDGYFEGDRDFVSHNREWLEWCEENHRLISAAPELLAFLKDCALQLGRLTGESLEAYARTFSALARAAIAKATL